MSAQGLDEARYRVVPRTLVFVRRGGRVLLLRRSEASAIWPGRYNGVGGHVEAGEDVASSALREVREETGLDVRDLRLGGVLHLTDAAAPVGVMVFVFGAESPSDAVAVSGEGEPVWVDVTEVATLPVVPDVVDLVSWLWPGDGPPIRARPAGEPFWATASLDGGAAPTFHVSEA